MNKLKNKMILIIYMYECMVMIINDYQIMNEEYI